jgi:molybdopterin synthase catalytic subunit
MRDIAGQALAKFGLRGVTLHHRSGFVPAGEASLFLRVTSAHRSAAFAAAEWIVEELKRSVPIWKRPRFVTPTGAIEKPTDRVMPGTQTAKI